MRGNPETGSGPLVEMAAPRNKKPTEAQAVLNPTKPAAGGLGWIHQPALRMQLLCRRLPDTERTGILDKLEG